MKSCTSPPPLQTTFLQNCSAKGVDNIVGLYNASFPYYSFFASFSDVLQQVMYVLLVSSPP